MRCTLNIYTHTQYTPYDGDVTKKRSKERAKQPSDRSTRALPQVESPFIRPARYNTQVNDINRSSTMSQRIGVARDSREPWIIGDAWLPGKKYLYIYIYIYICIIYRHRLFRWRTAISTSPSEANYRGRRRNFSAFNISISVPVRGMRRPGSKVSSNGRFYGLWESWWPRVRVRAIFALRRGRNGIKVLREEFF